MKDDVTKVEISKQDITNEKELPGAKLIIKDEKGKEVESWTSGKEPHIIEKALHSGRRLAIIFERR